MKVIIELDIDPSDENKFKTEFRNWFDKNKLIMALMKLEVDNNLVKIQDLRRETRLK